MCVWGGDGSSDRESGRLKVIYHKHLYSCLEEGIRAGDVDSSRVLKHVRLVQFKMGSVSAGFI